MDVDDLEAVLEGGFAKLREAQLEGTPLPADRTRGHDRDRHVEVEVDEHGLLTDIVYSDDASTVPPGELGAAVLEALQDAYRATGRARAGALPEIGNSEVSAQARHILGLEEN